jgi:serine/threonine-protein kinase HipA
MIKVWTDGAEAGLLDRSGDRGSTFLYLPETIGARAVSVTMPVRLASWDVHFGLAPIFEMNLPEGVLRERLRLTFAKATGTFDDFDLLAIVGRSQVGRIRYTGQKEKLEEDVPFQSVDEILARRRDGAMAICSLLS